MVCYETPRVKTPSKKIWAQPLTELIEAFVTKVRTRMAYFYDPYLERMCAPDDYILWGTYPRENILDIQMVRNEEGHWELQEVEVLDLKIQRIRLKDGTTHAILMHLFIAYGRVSLRYVLYHLDQFYTQHMSVEEYCKGKRFDKVTFIKWQKWLRDYSVILGGFGLTSSWRENREHLKEWVEKIIAFPRKWVIRSLRVLNLGVFQRRPMPENTEYQNSPQDG